MTHGGLAAALSANGTPLLGRQADKLLRQLQETRGDGDGLMLMASYGQGASHFRASADMLTFSSAALESASDNQLRFAALLLVCNNARVTIHTLLEWLGYYRPPMLRMLVQPTVNMGYLCGEFAVLLGTAAMWGAFPWVLYNSGPDSMLTPQGALAFAGWMTWIEPRCSTHTSFLGAFFGTLDKDDIAAPAFSMDVFFFWPTAGGILEASTSSTLLAGVARTEHSLVWLNATRWCLTGFRPDEPRPLAQLSRNRLNQTYAQEVRPYPEMLLNELRVRFRLPFRILPGGSGYRLNEATHSADGRIMRNFDGKLAPHPKRDETRCRSFGRAACRDCWASVWHSHAPELVQAWINTTFRADTPWKRGNPGV